MLICAQPCGAHRENLCFNGQFCARSSCGACPRHADRFSAARPAPPALDADNCWLPGPHQSDLRLERQAERRDAIHSPPDTIAGAGNLQYERRRYRVKPGDTMLTIVPTIIAIGCGLIPTLMQPALDASMQPRGARALRVTPQAQMHPRTAAVRALRGEPLRMPRE
jgi:hypothetical protein